MHCPKPCSWLRIHYLTVVSRWEVQTEPHWATIRVLQSDILWVTVREPLPAPRGSPTFLGSRPPFLHLRDQAGLPPLWSRLWISFSEPFSCFWGPLWSHWAHQILQEKSLSLSQRLQISNLNAKWNSTKWCLWGGNDFLFNLRKQPEDSKWQCTPPSFVISCCFSLKTELWIQVD